MYRVHKTLPESYHSINVKHYVRLVMERKWEHGNSRQLFGRMSRELQKKSICKDPYGKDSALIGNLFPFIKRYFPKQGKYNPSKRRALLSWIQSGSHDVCVFAFYVQGFWSLDIQTHLQGCRLDIVPVPSWCRSQVSWSCFVEFSAYLGWWSPWLFASAQANQREAVESLSAEQWSPTLHC